MSDANQRKLPLPVEAKLPDVKLALERHRNAVLVADPGAGKTTRVPLALMDDKWLGGRKIILLEPRRLAAQRAAAFMAQQLGEIAGQTVGYRIRGESRIGDQTRVEVVTEGVLTRTLLEDPALTDVGLVIFDEFHERSIHADLGLAFALDAQENLLPELRILIMSATLDGDAVSSLLGEAGFVTSTGRMYPVDTHYLTHEEKRPLEQVVVAAILRAIPNEGGDILVFLPGQREIRRVESLLSAKELPPHVVVHMLYGDAPLKGQQAALAPATKGLRKVILATSVAETSLTIDGVRIVIDSGLARTSRFDPGRSMSGLVTVPVSQSSADQRRGRAGRQGPGVCYRLWTARQNTLLPRFSTPEILSTDLAPLALALAAWGSPDASELKFLDPPPPAHLAEARGLLVRLGACADDGKLTPHGRDMVALPVHPRIGHMLLCGKELGAGALACDVAALIEERDILRGETDNDIDLHSRWHALRHGGAVNAPARDRLRSQAARLREILGLKSQSTDVNQLGMLLGMVYPERIAKREDEKNGRYRLAGGQTALLPRGSMLSRHKFLAVGEVDGIGSEVRIHLAEPLTEEDLRFAAVGNIAEVEELRWDDQSESIVARRTERIGAILLSEAPAFPAEDILREIMIGAIRKLGIEILPWTNPVRALRSRSEWLRRVALVGNEWPDLSHRHLTETVGEWLGPHLGKVKKRSQLAHLDLLMIVRSMYTWNQLKDLDRLAPTHLVVPTGSNIPIDYDGGDLPVLAVRLQEMFGETQTPTVGGGKVKVQLHLLSPARRPLAVTQDLPSFWKNAYPAVRKDMRGRYPKHFWPEDPLQAEPTRRRKKS